jgi:hypothetical protein
MLLANPHLPWTGDSRWYQVQLTIAALGSWDGTAIHATPGRSGTEPEPARATGVAASQKPVRRSETVSDFCGRARTGI